MQVKKQQLEPDMERWTGSKLGNEYVKVVYCYQYTIYCILYTIYNWATVSIRSTICIVHHAKYQAG